jgi:4-hydroxybenzoate polyprenyltransferase
MSLTFLSISAVIFVASMVLYYQWLMADRRGKSPQYKKTRWISIWIGLAVSAAFLLLFVQTD